jgi:hypothetical protein
MPVNDTEKVVYGGLAVAAVLIPALLRCAGLATALSVVLAAVMLGGVMVMAWRQWDSRSSEALHRTPAALPPEPPAQAIVALVPTDAPDYRFLLSATVSWRRLAGATHADPGAAARAAIIDRAAALTKGITPGDAHMAQERLAAALGCSQPDSERQVNAWASGVTVDLPDGDADRVRALTDLRKDTEIWERKRDHERNVRRYLSEDVLTSTGSALVWWLARHEDRIDEAVAHIDRLATLSAVAQNRDIPQPQQGRLHVVPAKAEVADDNWNRELRATHDLIRELFPLADDEQRTGFAGDLADIADKFGLHDYSQHVRQLLHIPSGAEQALVGSTLRSDQRGPQRLGRGQL